LQAARRLPATAIAQAPACSTLSGLFTDDGSATAYFGSFQDVFSRRTHTTTRQTFVAGSIGAFTIESSNVPEPGTLAQPMIGLLGFALHRRKSPANPGNEPADYR
jgi:hypothetical protein